MKSLMSVDETAEMLGIAKATVYKYVSERRIPFVKIGARVLFERTAMTQWIRQRSVSSESMEVE